MNDTTIDDDLNAPGPSDAVILKNTLSLIESLLKDIKVYGLYGYKSHDGPVLHVSTHMTNGQRLTYVMDHFIRVWDKHEVPRALDPAGRAKSP